MVPAAAVKAAVKAVAVGKAVIKVVAVVKAEHYFAIKALTQLFNSASSPQPSYICLLLKHNYIFGRICKSVN